MRSPTMRARHVLYNIFTEHTYDLPRPNAPENNLVFNRFVRTWSRIISGLRAVHVAGLPKRAAVYFSIKMREITQGTEVH